MPSNNNNVGNPNVAIPSTSILFYFGPFVTSTIDGQPVYYGFPTGVVPAHAGFPALPTVRVHDPRTGLTSGHGDPDETCAIPSHRAEQYYFERLPHFQPGGPLDYATLTPKERKKVQKIERKLLASFKNITKAGAEISQAIDRLAIQVRNRKLRETPRN